MNRHDNDAVRVLCPQLARITTLTVLYLKPIQMYLAAKYLGLDTSQVLMCRDRIFHSHGLDLETSHLTAILQTYTDHHLGVPFGVSDIRHINIAIARAHVQDNTLVVQTTQKYLSQQASHSDRVSHTRYARTTSNPVLTSLQVEIYIALSIMWWEVRLSRGSSH